MKIELSILCALNIIFLYKLLAFDKNVHDMLFPVINSLLS